MENYSRNQAAVNELKKLGYPLPNIRRALLELVDLRQQAIAKEVGIYRTGVTKYIKGFRQKTVHLEAIADLLDVPADELFSDVYKAA